MLSYFASLDAIAAPEVTVSVSGKLHTSYNVLIMFMYVVIGNVTDNLNVVFSCYRSSVSHNVGLYVCLSVCWSVRNEFYSSVMMLVVYICCYSYCSLDY